MLMERELGGPGDREAAADGCRRLRAAGEPGRAQVDDERVVAADRDDVPDRPIDCRERRIVEPGRGSNSCRPIAGRDRRERGSGRGAGTPRDRATRGGRIPAASRSRLRPWRRPKGKPSRGEEVGRASVRSRGPGYPGMKSGSRRTLHVKSNSERDPTRPAGGPRKPASPLSFAASFFDVLITPVRSQTCSKRWDSPLGADLRTGVALVGSRSWHFRFRSSSTRA